MILTELPGVVHRAPGRTGDGGYSPAEVFRQPPPAGADGGAGREWPVLHFGVEVGREIRQRLLNDEYMERIQDRFGLCPCFA